LGQNVNFQNNIRTNENSDILAFLYKAAKIKKSRPFPCTFKKKKQKLGVTHHIPFPGCKMLKKYVCCRGFAPYPAEGDYSSPPDSLTGKKRKLIRREKREMKRRGGVSPNKNLPLHQLVSRHYKFVCRARRLVNCAYWPWWHVDDV